jgi:hypothetical protein
VSRLLVTGKSRDSVLSAVFLLYLYTTCIFTFPTNSFIPKSFPDRLTIAQNYLLIGWSREQKTPHMV